MEKDRTLRGFIILLIAVSLILAWAGFWILYRTDNLFDGYIYIPLYFFICGLIYILVLKQAIRPPAKNAIRYFVGLRMFKLMFSLLAVVLYGILVGQYIKEFVITFLSFYILYMILETGLFFGIRSNDKDILN